MKLHINISNALREHMSRKISLEYMNGDSIDSVIERAYGVMSEGFRHLDNLYVPRHARVPDAIV